LHEQIRNQLRGALPEFDAAVVDLAIERATPRSVRVREICGFVDRRYSVGAGKEFCVQGSELPLRVAALLGREAGAVARALFLGAPGTPTLVEYGVE
jgi:hypothetical protein